VINSALKLLLFLLCLTVVDWVLEFGEAEFYQDGKAHLQEQIKPILESAEGGSHNGQSEEKKENDDEGEASEPESFITYD